MVDVIKNLGEGNPYARSMVRQMKLAKLPGSAAPELAVDNHYGEFSSLASMRGKVVLLDFTADSDFYCTKAYPYLKKMYADLYPKGLEVIGLNRYEGFYKDREGLTPKAEFIAKKGLMKEYGLPWPLLFGPRKNQINYGVEGIPHYVVIGRDGKVASIAVGYNEPLNKQLRATVEKALEAGNNK